MSPALKTKTEWLPRTTTPATRSGCGRVYLAGGAQRLPVYAATLKLAEIGGAALWLHPKFVGLCGIASRMDLREEQRQGHAKERSDRMIPWTGRSFLIAGFCEYEQGLWRRTTEPTLYLPDRWCA